MDSKSHQLCLAKKGGGKKEGGGTGEGLGGQLAMWQSRENEAIEVTLTLPQKLFRRNVGLAPAEARRHVDRRFPREPVHR